MWQKTLSPGGYLTLPWGYIYVLNHKKMYKIRLWRFFFKLATNEWSDRTLVLTSKLCPLGAVCPCLGAVYMYKIMKKCIKWDFKENFLEPATNDRDDKMFLWTSKFRLQGVSAPAPGLYTCTKSCRKVSKIRLQRDFCSKWPKGHIRFLLTSKFCPLGVVCPWPAAIYFY